MPALEVIVSTGRIEEGILDPLRTSEIEEVVRDGSSYEDADVRPVAADPGRDGAVTVEDALETASNPHLPSGGGAGLGRRLAAR